MASDSKDAADPDRLAAIPCSFCGNSLHDVRTIVTSGDTAICDACVVTALEIAMRQPGSLHLRVAYALFRAVVSIGRILTPGRRASA